MTMFGTALAAALGMGAAAAVADAGFYLGGSIGQAGIQDRENYDLDEIEDRFRIRFDDDDTGYKLYGGYQFNNFFGVEAGYVDFGSPSDRFNVSVGDGDLGGKLDVDLTGWTAALMGNLPVGPVNLFAKAGVLAWDADAKATIFLGEDAVRVSRSDDGRDFMYGAGVSFDLGRLGIRAEYERFEVSDLDDVDLASVGLTWFFGG